MEILIKSIESRDWYDLRGIYLEGLSTGQATFETEAPSPEQWDSGHLPFGRLGAYSVPEGRLVGWAALSSVSKRKEYVGVAEVSVYIAAAARGKGVGRALLQALILESERNGIWTLQASIFPENQASLRIHESLGFRIVGQRERVSTLNGVWRNTVILERRSNVVGVD
ncbi:MAG TPA: GNAT family N-acetyltransferase [Pyrinomonadaceae bacterium]|nr:GNAT family N-acetyltransferase [Pyrinomonadaceae bacterium]